MGRLLTPPAAIHNSRMTTYVQRVLGLNHSSHPAVSVGVLPLVTLIHSMIKHASQVQDQCQRCVDCQEKESDDLDSQSGSAGPAVERTECGLCE